MKGRNMFLDDGFGTADTLALTQALSQQIKKKVSLIMVFDKCFWAPVQVLEWLGAVLNTTAFTICIQQ